MIYHNHNYRVFIDRGYMTTITTKEGGVCWQSTDIVAGIYH